VSGGKVLSTMSDSVLRRSLSRPGTTTPAAERARLAGGTRAVVWLWVPVDRQSPPASVVTSLVLEQGVVTASLRRRSRALFPGPAGGGLRSAPRCAAGSGSPATDPTRSRVIGAPLIPIGGTPSIAQRFAIDWVKVGDDNRTFAGDSLRNSSYLAWGQDALAVANGVVVATKDGIPRTFPASTRERFPSRWRRWAGTTSSWTWVDGRFAFYAHLQPGTLKVKVGDRCVADRSLDWSATPQLHRAAPALSPLGR
jgi:hypothetical protein